MITLFKKHVVEFYRVPPGKIVLYIFMFVGLFIFLYYLGSGVDYDYSKVFTKESIEQFILGAGIWSWLVYIVLISIMVLSPLPSSLFVLIGGYLFNPFLVILLTIIGEAIGATGNFFIGRKLGKRVLLKRWPKVRSLFERYGEHVNRQNVFFLSMIPVGTSNFTGYLAGMSDIDYRDYIISWITGITFVSLIIAFLGHSAKIESGSMLLHLVLISVGLAIIVRLYFRKTSKE